MVDEVLIQVINQRMKAPFRSKELRNRDTTNAVAKHCDCQRRLMLRQHAICGSEITAFARRGSKRQVDRGIIPTGLVNDSIVNSLFWRAAYGLSQTNW